METKNKIKKGFFISLEGPDGSGKTTLAKLLAEQLTKASFIDKFNHEKPVVITREPGGNNVEFCEAIRHLVLNVDVEMEAETEALLFAASRAEHIAKFIIPNLDENRIVICDRFVESSLVYQGMGRNIGYDWIKLINKVAFERLLPDLTFILMINPELGLERIKKSRTSEVNRLDKEQIEFHQKAYDAYKGFANSGGRFVEVDASLSSDEQVKIILNVIKQRI